MPELPEVETLCLQLQKKITGAKINSTLIFDQKLRGVEDVGGRVIREVRRVGKTILIKLDNGTSIAIHLRMTGRLFLHLQQARLDHGRWRMMFAGVNIELIDPRRFATVKVIVSPGTFPANDLLTGFSKSEFMKLHANRQLNIKGLLMNPNALAGIGNIYACEILHAAGISPHRGAHTISTGQWSSIFRQARRILKKAVKNRGTSISDWRDLYGRKGENQNELKVYGQEGRQCSRCGGEIVRMKQGGRSTFYCPGCQK